MNSSPQVVDVLAHPVCDDLNQRLPNPWRQYPLPRAEHYLYSPPLGEYWQGLGLSTDERSTGSSAQGYWLASGAVDDMSRISSPSGATDYLLGDGRADMTVLLPLGRGIQPDPIHDAAIAATLNEWLAETWLAAAPGRFRGTIRISSQDPAKAVAEIARWAQNEAFVQIGVPLEATAPYGDPRYWPIWEAAAAAGLPVVIHAEVGAGIEPQPTAVGFPLTHFALHVLRPLNGVIHLSSLITQGVFNRWPTLQVVFSDGGYELYRAILWRLNHEWRETRYQTPWVDRRPSDYIRDNTHFILRSTDTVASRDHARSVMDLSNAEGLLMYGSGFPYWDYRSASDVRSVLPPEHAAAIMGGNAAALYGLAPADLS